MAQAGLRATRQRLLVLKTLAAEPHDATAQEIYSRLRQSGEPVGLATVYRTLALLEADGRVRRLDRGRFIACEPGHHHHLVCVSCGAVEETELCAAPPVTEVHKRHGFVVQHHEADLYGVCGKCA